MPHEGASLKKLVDGMRLDGMPGGVRGTYAAQGSPRLGPGLIRSTWSSPRQRSCGHSATVAGVFDGLRRACPRTRQSRFKVRGSEVCRTVRLELFTFEKDHMLHTGRECSAPQRGVDSAEDRVFLAE